MEIGISRGSETHTEGDPHGGRGRADTHSGRWGRGSRRLDLECKGGWVLCLGGSGRLLEGVNRDFHGSRKLPGVAYLIEWECGAMQAFEIATVGELWVGIQCPTTCAALDHLRTHMVDKMSMYRCQDTRNRDLLAAKDVTARAQTYERGFGCIACVRGRRGLRKALCVCGV